MRFNAAGDAATGAGGTGQNLAINGAPVAAVATDQAGMLGGPSWLTALTVLYQSGGFAGGGPWILQSYNENTTALATVSSSAASFARGGGGIWAAFIADGTSGVRTSIGGLGPWAASSLGDVSPTGQIVRVDDYQASGGLTVYSPTGAVTLALPDTTAWNLPGPGNITCRQNVLTWRTEPGAWQAIGTSGAALTYQVRVNDVTWLTPLTLASGELLFLEYDNTAGQLTLRYARVGQGWVIATTGAAFYPDCIEVSAGVVRIGYCTTSGEAPSSLVVADLTLATNSMRVGTVVGTTLVYGLPASNPRVIFDVTAASTGPGSANAVGHPRFEEPFVDPRTGKVVARAWTNWIENVTRGGNATAAQIAAIPTAAPPPGFSVITSTGEPPINANTAVLGVEPGPGIDIELIPPAQIVKISAIPGKGVNIPPGMPGTDGDDGLMGPPGVSGVDGPAGPVGPTGPAIGLGIPGVDGEDGEPGPPGMLGAPGQTGATGATGPAIGLGIPGFDGEDGDPGPPGVNQTVYTPGSGNVVGPPSATNNDVVVFDGTTGTAIKDGGAPLGSVPLVVTQDTTVPANFGWVVPESLEIAAGIIFAIDAGARVEVTGQVVSANIFIIKPSDESVISNNTLHNDNHFQFPVSIGEKWIIMLMLVYETAATADFQAVWALPSGSTSTWFGGPRYNSAEAFIGNAAVSATTAVGGGGLGIGSLTGYYVYTTITAGSTGTVILQWSQLNVIATSTTLKAGSFMTAYRVPR